MRFVMTALLAAASLGGCAVGPQGNPNNQPYADQPGGTIAVQPQVISTASYDPYGTPAPFQDMQYSAVAITPAPTPPMNLTPRGAAPMPQGGALMNQGAARPPR
jgi:hypothetical protein